MRAAKNIFASHRGPGVEAAALLVLAVLALAACENVQRHGLDPLASSGRLTAAPISYDALMHIGATARGAGDLDTAVGLYRRAAELNLAAAAPFTAAGYTLVEMGQINEAIVAYRAALAREPRDPAALRGLARAYLRTGKPELALEPLGVASEQAPDDPKLLQLIGVAEDFAGRHAAAQSQLSARPRISARLSRAVDQSCAVAGAVGTIRRGGRGPRVPIALGPGGTPGRTADAGADLCPARRQPGGRADRAARPRSAIGNAATGLFDTLRALSPEARGRAIRSISTHPGAGTLPARPRRRSDGATHWPTQQAPRSDHDDGFEVLARHRHRAVLGAVQPADQRLQIGDQQVASFALEGA